ncbi:unnamed protein product, partial [Scytosiphon promiscuus]
MTSWFPSLRPARPSLPILRRRHVPWHVGFACRVVLRKLWAKMAEDDWRTVAKAALVLHCLAR